MKEADFALLSDQNLGEEFVRYAQIWSDGVTEGDNRQANKAATCLEYIDRVFAGRSRESRLTLLPYLEHDDPGVRYQIAHHLLPVVPKQAIATIRAVSVGRNTTSGDAKFTLSFYGPNGQKIE